VDAARLREQLEDVERRQREHQANEVAFRSDALSFDQADDVREKRDEIDRRLATAWRSVAALDELVEVRR
jgi:hypothetical protein